MANAALAGVHLGHEWKLRLLDAADSVEKLRALRKAVLAEIAVAQQALLRRVLVEKSRSYRGCPLGVHEPGEPHHYTCWAEFS